MTFTVTHDASLDVHVENSFIPVRGVGEKTERRLWQSGVTHWDAFDGDAVGPTLAERIEAFIETGRQRLEADDARFFGEALPSRSRWRLYGSFGTDACYLDIETTGLSTRRDRVTTVSVHRAGETETLVRGQDLTADTLHDRLSPAQLLVTFNGAQFDVPFLERALGVEINLPHIDLRYLCRRLGFTGGLAAIERTVGIDRDHPDLSGVDAVRLWHQYERGDEGALETLIAYNREDTENLAPLMETVADRLHRDVFEAARDDGRA